MSETRHPAYVIVPRARLCAFIGHLVWPARYFGCRVLASPRRDKNFYRSLRSPEVRRALPGELVALIICQK